MFSYGITAFQPESALELHVTGFMSWRSPRVPQTSTSSGVDQNHRGHILKQDAERQNRNQRQGYVTSCVRPVLLGDWVILERLDFASLEDIVAQSWVSAGTL